MRPQPPTIKRQRCAIYTRKSTDHNLDLTFNSLDAQREACEAYVKSQAHEGWTLIPDHFDDGAFSGASLNRPAVQALLDLVKAKQVDIIVVYKVDRLTRSLADFAKLVELFDANGVSFVSVTQSFNTTSSMGRLTLNVLLSFAQFEREVIGERVRDKIAASKRKGIWVGGMIPLGYRSVNKKLQIEPDEADLVRKIFRDYLALGSIRDLAKALCDEGLKPKPRKLANGTEVGADRFWRGSLALILKNRFYVGDVAYKGEIHRGEHEPILDRDLFDAVQARLEERKVEWTKQKTASQALLIGRIFDDRGNVMTPSHCNKQGVRYRYYVSRPLIEGRKQDAGSVGRLPAPDVEAMVVKAVWKEIARAVSMEAERRARHGAFTTPTGQSADLSPSIALTGAAPDRQQPEDRELIAAWVERVEVHKERLVVRLKMAQDGGAQTGCAEMKEDRNRRSAIPPLDKISLDDAPEAANGTERKIIIPYEPPTAPRKGVRHTPSGTIDPKTQETLLSAIARSKRWMNEILVGKVASFDDIALRENLAPRHVRFLAPLAFLSPRGIRAILAGSAPSDLSLTELARALPYRWENRA